MPEEKKPTPMMGKYSLYAVLAFIFGFFMWPVALVLGILGITEIKKHPEVKGKAFAWIGIFMIPALSILAFLFWIILFIVMGAVSNY